MKVKDVPICDIRPYENNPRDNDDAVDLVANSIREFGFKQPIVVDADGTIIAGHTRYRAARSLGLATVPAVYADDLTPGQVNAYRLADNKVAEAATWDIGNLDVLREAGLATGCACCQAVWQRGDRRRHERQVMKKAPNGAFFMPGICYLSRLGNGPGMS